MTLELEVTVLAILIQILYILTDTPPLLYTPILALLVIIYIILNRRRK